MYIVVYYDPESNRIETEEAAGRKVGRERVDWLLANGASAAELLVLEPRYSMMRDTWRIRQRR